MTIPRVLPELNNDPDRIRVAKTMFSYPRFSELHEAMTDCIKKTAESGEANCLSLDGLTGVGKSTLVQSYAEAFPRYDTDWGTKIPVFYMMTPSPVTVKAMATAMLEALGDPGANQGETWPKNTRIVKFLDECDVRLVVLDDFHNLIDRKTNKVMADVSNWLKALIKRSNVPFVVVGTNGQVKNILDGNEELSRLFTRKELKPFDWDAKDKKTVVAFAALISSAEQALSINLTSEIDRYMLLNLLHQATNGLMSNVMNLLREARWLHDGNGEILLSTLATAYEERLEEHIKIENPFVNIPNLPKPIVQEDPQDSTGNRGKSNKERSPSIGGILTTKP